LHKSVELAGRPGCRQRKSANAREALWHDLNGRNTFARETEMDEIDPDEPPLFDIDDRDEPDVEGDESKGGLTLEGVEIPFELLEHGNGRLPDSALQRIGIGGHRLNSAAAEAFGRFRAAAKETGIDLTLTDSYRNFDQQVDLKRRKPNLSATPGKSVHGWGFAVDVSIGMPPKPFGQTVYSWLKANGPGIGWHLGRPKDEPWHWVYRGPAGGGGAEGGGKIATDSGELAVGSTGERVRFAQQCLKITVDGEFGTQTEQAVRAFQASNGLAVDGRIGSRTWARLVASTTPAERPELRVGASGDAVRWVQQRLGITADGEFGPATERAVEAFQRDNGLADDGVVGARTWGVLAA